MFLCHISIRTCTGVTLIIITISSLLYDKIIICKIIYILYNSKILSHLVSSGTMMICPSVILHRRRRRTLTRFSQLYYIIMIIIIMYNNGVRRL